VVDDVAQSRYHFWGFRIEVDADELPGSDEPATWARYDPG
jgi:hypothetical protein